MFTIGRVDGQFSSVRRVSGSAGSAGSAFSKREKPMSRVRVTAGTFWRRQMLGSLRETSMRATTAVNENCEESPMAQKLSHLPVQVFLR